MAALNFILLIHILIGSNDSDDGKAVLSCWVCTELSIKPRISYVCGKHSVNWSTSPIRNLNFLHHFIVAYVEFYIFLWSNMNVAANFIYYTYSLYIS